MTDRSDTPHRIVVVDDHPRLRRALCALVESDNRFQVVGEAESAAAALDIVATADPDIAVLDISLKGPMDGLQLAAQLHLLHPSLKILLLSLHSGPEFLTKGRAAGASGFLHKGRAADSLLDALETILAGQPYGL